MLNPRNTKLVFIALILWLAAGWTGAHGHFCFDGLEPPISIHLGITGEHLVDHADEQHLDMDFDLSETPLAKLVKIDLSLLFVVAFSLLILISSPRIYCSFYAARYIRRIAGLRPPLRAPPFFPA